MLEAARLYRYVHESKSTTTSGAIERRYERNATNFVDVALYTDGVPPLAGSSRETRIVGQKWGGSILVRQWNALCSRQTTRFLCTLYRSCQLYRVLDTLRKKKDNG